MVDRPIKKADRQNPPVENDGTPKSSAAPSKKSSSDRGADKGGRRDSNKRDEPKAPENLALMRGPKPSKAKPPVIKVAEPEVTEDAAAEGETSAEATAEA
jgi:hypothetical protein